MSFLRPLVRPLRQSLIWALKKLVRLYQVTLSPLFPPSCRYSPSCSAYALQALEVHGPLKGSLLAARRVLSCHPFERLGGGSGFDPVPPCGGCEHDAPTHTAPRAAPSSPSFPRV